MASRSERATVAIISVVHGALSALIKQKSFSRIDMRDSLSALYREVGILRDTWSTNHTEKDILWTLRQMLAWNTFLSKIGLDEGLQTKILVKISLMATGDLLERLKNRRRIEKIDKLYQNLEQIDNFIDPQGTAFNSLDEAEIVLNALYKEIGFT